MWRLLVMLAAALAWVGGPAIGEELAPKEVAAGRKVYVAKCAKCHKFYEPTNYSGPNWSKWMEKMSVKSKLNEKEAGLLARYLEAYRAGQLSGKPQDKPKPVPSGGGGG